MSFDKPTRNLLAKMTAAARDRLAEDIAAQLQTAYGLYPDGSRLDVAQMPEERHAAAELRALLDHFESAEPDGRQRKANAYQRLVREIGFTLLNRLAALRLCEERGLVIECVRAGMNSAGFQLYDRLAGGALGNRYHTYRAFLACMFDELAADLGALFDRSTPQSAVFPSEPALNDVLALLNDPELTGRKIWQQDETIGWIYQYYNDPAERKKMRDESQAPRNSRELAVRNQFFTPRYVVEFLTDNTLGRTWYEMRQGQTKLTEQCRYLVQRPHPIFLTEGEEAPEPWSVEQTSQRFPNLPSRMWVRPDPDIQDIPLIFEYALTVYADAYAPENLGEPLYTLAERIHSRNSETGKWEGSFEELRCVLGFEQGRWQHYSTWPEGKNAEDLRALYRAICEQWDREVDVVPFRARKDPRRLRVLDPACGSGHFLLYAFDLLETIYAEAYDDPGLGAELRDAFPDRADFTRQVPRLILENNLHGIDIDPRAAQIAALALWLRAQRAWQAQKLEAAERPRIGRTHIVVAEPMPGDEGLLEEFINDLPKDQHPEIIGSLLRTVFEKMKLAGEAGSLLKIEEELNEAIEQARTAWGITPQAEQLSFLPGEPKPKQLGLDLNGVTDESFWQQAEGLVLRAMEGYARQAEDGEGIRRRLFAGDAVQGFAFIDLCNKRFDVVLMNPPFGEVNTNISPILDWNYPTWNGNLLCAFIERGWLLSSALGSVGAIYDRTAIVKSTYEDFRKSILAPDNRLFSMADLGWEVLEANVEVTTSVLLHGNIQNSCAFIDVRETFHDEKANEIENNIRALYSDPSQKTTILYRGKVFQKFPNAVIGYDFPDFLRRAFADFPSLEDVGYKGYQGHALKADKHFRLWWEIPETTSAYTSRLFNGDGFSPYLIGFYDCVVSPVSINSLPKNSATVLRNKEYHGLPGVCFGKRGEYFCAHLLPPGFVFTVEGQSIPVEDIEKLWELLAFLNTPLVRFSLNKYCGQHKYSGYVNLFPYKKFVDLKNCTEQVKFATQAILRAKAIDEIEPFFSLYRFQGTIKNYAEHIETLIESAWTAITNAETSCHNASLNAYQLSFSERQMLDDFRFRQPNYQSPIEDADMNTHCYWIASHLVLSNLVGLIFGRWDITKITDTPETSIVPDLLYSIPDCPSALLKRTNIHSSNYIDDDYKHRWTQTDNTQYAINIPIDGILVDDSGFGDHPLSNEADILRGVDSTMQLIWPECSGSIGAEVCQILDVKDLREYFRKPSGFFADHLKRYSKSRRQAPIYWPLSTSSGSYTLWIYYHRLNSETLYTAVNRFVSPKIEQVERYLGKLEDDLTQVFGRSAGELRDKVDSTRAFLAELNAFRAELLRVAKLPYQPDLNDGVIINAAPLYKLFRLPRWSRDCQAVWEKLEGGEYDWAHMAYVLWPDRVREKCKSDKSLAIAHGLEALYLGEEKGKKGKRRKKIKEEQDGLGF